ncbi:Natural cytotoxicity triggering receptor 3 ligand 1 [Vulpes lagopus]
MAHGPPLLLLLPLLLLVLRFGTGSSGLQVEMAGTTQKVLLNDNATIVCKIHGYHYLDITVMGITWYWKHQASATEVKLFEFFDNHQMTLRSGAHVSERRLQRGDASLQLPGVQLKEAGEYRCEVVVTPYKAVGTVNLEVVAYPVSSLSPEQAMVKENEEQRILCMASRFYPKNITITWKKWTPKDPRYLEISEGIITNSTTEDEDGMFRVTSYLMVKPSLEDNMTVYQCVVWHESLPTSQSRNFTLIVTETEKTTFVWNIIVISIVVILVIILLWLYVLFKRKELCQTKTLSSTLRASPQNIQNDIGRTEEV